MTRDLSVSFVPLRVKTERIARPMMKAINPPIRAGDKISLT